MTPSAADARERPVPPSIVARHLPAGFGSRSSDQAVALLPRRPTHWVDLLHYYRAIAERTEFTPVMIAATPELAGHAERARREGVYFVAVAPIRQQDHGHFPKAAAAANWLAGRGEWGLRLVKLLNRDRMRHSLPFALPRLSITRKWLRRQYAVAKDVFDFLSPSALVLSGDRELGPFPAFLRAARERGIPRIVAGVQFASPEADAIPRRARSRFFADPLAFPPAVNLAAARRYPQQQYRLPFGSRLFSPGWLIYALAKEDMIIPNPWVQGSNSDAILVDSEQRARRYAELGVPPERVRVVGRPIHDQLYALAQRRDALKREIEQRYRFAPGKPLLICSVPTAAEQANLPWDEHRRRLVALFDLFDALDANVLCSFHPRAKRENYARELAGRKLRVMDGELFEHIAAADIFVCEASTTIPWAILCGVPTIDFAFSGVVVPEWDDYPGVIAAPDLASCKRTLAALLADPAGLQRLRREQEARADTICIFDGRAEERFIGILREMASGREANRNGGA